MLSRLTQFFQRFTSYHEKISFIAFGSVFLSLLLMIAVSYWGIDALHRSTALEMERSIKAVNQSYLQNYLDISADYMNGQIRNLRSEQATLASIYQTVLDNESDFAPFLDAAQKKPLFRATLIDNGRWRQNSPDEISSVLVPRNMNDENMQLSLEARRTLRNSSLLNMLLPSFYN